MSKGNTTNSHGLYRGNRLITTGDEGTLKAWTYQDDQSPPLKVWPVKVTRLLPKRVKATVRKGVKRGK